MIPYNDFPRINNARNWLGELGFYIGDELIVECEKGCLCIWLKQQEPEFRAVCDGGGGYYTVSHDSLKNSNGKCTRYAV